MDELRKNVLKKITHRAVHGVPAVVMGKTRSKLYGWTELAVAINVDDALVPDAAMNKLLDTDMVTHNLVVFEWALMECR